MGVVKMQGAVQGDRWPEKALWILDQVLFLMDYSCLHLTFPGSNHNKPMDPAKRAQLARKLDKKVQIVGFPCFIRSNNETQVNEQEGERQRKKKEK